ncbi:Alpha/Beta hydrolase protein [Zopfochytrium polystomum]|nr:Alpha/Beta hydrolase protein [Zopfochytrium polystomum]
MASRDTQTSSCSPSPPTRCRRWGARLLWSPPLAAANPVPAPAPNPGLSSFAKTIKDKAESAAHEVKDAANKVVDTAKSVASNVITDVKETLSKKSPASTLKADPAEVQLMTVSTRLQQAVTCDRDRIAKWDCQPCKHPDVAKTHDVVFFNAESTGMQGYAAINGNMNAITVVFRGSVNIENWIHNIQLTFKDMDGWGSGVRVHRGFHDTYESVVDAAVSAVTKLTAKCPSCSVIFSGHSLGGAIATLAAVDMVNKGIVKASTASIITNGQPRAGNAEFAGLVNSKGFARLLRVPPTSFGYRHFSGERWISFGGYAVRCNDASKGGEDTNCAFTTLPDSSIADHLSYYGLRIVRSVQWDSCKK